MKSQTNSAVLAVAAAAMAGTEFAGDAVEAAATVSAPAASPAPAAAPASPQKPNEPAFTPPVAKPTLPRDKHHGTGGSYVLVKGKRVRVDEDGNPLPDPDAA